MSTLNPKLNLHHPQYSSSQLAESITDILNNNTLAAFSNIMGEESYIFTSYFAYSDKLELYYFSGQTTQHVKNLDRNKSTAVAVWNPTVNWGKDLQGIQLFGTSQLVQGIAIAEAIMLYTKRFVNFADIIKMPEDFAKGITESRFFVVKVKTLKLIDEVRFGHRNYITVELNRA